MRTAIATLQSKSPYSQSRHHDESKIEKELPDDYEERTWRSRMHVNKDGYVFIPPMSFKNCLSQCAKYLSMQIPGRGKQTFTKNIEAGVLVSEPVVLPYKASEVEGERLFVPADGKRGGPKRVWRTFPFIPEWKADVLFYILDDTVTEDVFRYHLEQAGKFIGIGRFRPRNNGYYGRFEVIDIVFE